MTEPAHAAIEALAAEFRECLRTLRVRGRLGPLLERLEALLPEAPDSVTGRTLRAHLLATTSRPAEAADEALVALRLGATERSVLLMWGGERAFDLVAEEYAAAPVNSPLRDELFLPLSVHAERLGRTAQLAALAAGHEFPARANESLEGEDELKGT
jgi:hypothetical protein